MIRPLIRPQKKPDFAKAFWDQAEKSKTVEKNIEQQVFHLSEKEAKRCRYEITDMTQRMAECTVHKYHGVRLHPPHLWNLDAEGKVYFKQDGKWEQWFPNIKANVSRFQE